MVSPVLCRSYSRNKLKHLRMVLRRTGERSLGREVPLKRAYMYIKCYRPGVGDIHLLRESAENPIGTSKAAKSYAQNWCTGRVEGGGATLLKWGLKRPGFSGKGEAPPWERIGEKRDRVQGFVMS